MTVSPLLKGDPPQLGAARVTGRIDSSDAGVVYAGTLDGERVVLVLLSAGAEQDSYGRARFNQAVECMRSNEPALVVDFGNEPETAPWAALRSRNPGTQAASSLLAAVTMENLRASGRRTGPEFRPHWFPNNAAGRWRIWPLPWPVAMTTAGRWTFLVAFALVVAIASFALWLAIHIFADQPPSPVPQPRPGPITQPPPLPTPTPDTPTPGPTTGPPNRTPPTNTPLPPIV